MAAPVRLLPRTMFERLSTSYRILVILSLALLPLGAIALIASLQSARTSIETQREEGFTLATHGARYLGSQMDFDTALLRGAAETLAAGTSPAEACQRVDAIFRDLPSPRRWALLGADGGSICGNIRVERPALALDGRTLDVTVDDEAITLLVRAGANAAVIRYDASSLRRLLPWVIEDRQVRQLAIERDGNALVLSGRAYGGDSRRLDSLSEPLGIGGLNLRLSIAVPPMSGADALLMLLPIAMWGAAAVIGFVVVDRTLVRPLEQLRGAVAAHDADGAFSAPAFRTPANEIRDLSDAFTRFAQNQVSHEADLSSALQRQTALTREVHHRVKNNLQVIASLISLHARAERSNEALAAYAAIQRRVDALAIVHRNHYAQLDEGGGLELKPMMAELVANLRASTGATMALAATGMRATLDHATTLAFLVTELVELAIDIDASGAIAVALDRTETGGRLSVTSPSLRPGEALRERLGERYERILNGLTRQLRTTLDREEGAGSYAVRFPALEK